MALRQLECSALHQGTVTRHGDEVDWWVVTLRYEGREMTLSYYMGSGLKGVEPTRRDVLGSLLMDADLVEEYGDDPDDWQAALGGDSIKQVLADMAACKRQTEALRALLGDDYDSIKEAFIP
jgi:hypothetical protein